MPTSTRTLLIAAVPLLALGACSSSLSSEDRATLEQTRAAAQDAKASAAAAERNSAASAAAAQRSAEEARAAADRADRMFQRTQRKGAGS